LGPSMISRLTSATELNLTIRNAQVTVSRWFVRSRSPRAKRTP
jgi:hypothetical protein